MVRIDGQCQQSQRRLFYKHTYRDPILFSVLTHHIHNLIDYHNLDENHLVTGFEPRGHLI